MSRACVIISGQTIAFDRALHEGLCRFTRVIQNMNNHLLPTILTKRDIDLILFELAVAELEEVALIRKIKLAFPKIEIVLLDDCDDSDLRAQAFANGVRDAFRKPFKIDLIVERVHVLLQKADRSASHFSSPTV